MPMVTNVLRPNTCACVITYLFDSSLPETQWEENYTGITVAKCLFHSALTDLEAYTQVIKKEVKLKSFVENTLFAALTECKSLDADGNPVWAPGISYRWSFDSSRKLLVQMEGVTTRTLPELQAIVDSSFPTDGVRVI